MTLDLVHLKQALIQVMTQDRHGLARRLEDIQRLIGAGENKDKITGHVQKWQVQVNASKARVAQRQQLISSPIQYPDLPVAEKREEIAALIAQHQVIILAGETGSGKTTQIPKICLDLGLGRKGLIGHTQPRRIAAQTLAARIAEELHTNLGEIVGFQVRFTEQCSESTLIKVMTDGILLAEIQQDKFLSRYDTLIIDEAHERSLNIDFLLGYLKQLLPRRADLKVIITSATIDVERFSQHFNNAPVIEVSGRTYPVQTWYRPPVLSSDEDGEGDEDQFQSIIDAIREIESYEKQSGQRRGGDILVFMAGERDIREAANAIRKANFPHLEILPFYARLSLAEQQKVFASHTGRRLVLATNVAETSITVPGIRYVIDPGYARISRYSYRTKVQRLPVEPISQASANQRKGRCGRVSEGICIRLYSEEDFNQRPAFTDAEILRTNLAAVILQMLQLRMGDIHRFPFLDRPDQRLINDGFKLLEELQAVNTKGQLTDVGRKLAHLAVDPRLARMLLAAQALHCVREVLIIVSALSVQDPRERPIEKQQAADQQHRRFFAENSDFLAYVNLWNHFEQLRQTLSQNQLRKQCKKEFLSYLRLREWRDIHHQLRLALKALNIKENDEAANFESVHQALLTGLLGNLGFNAQEREYIGSRNRKFTIFPGSALARKTPKWLMAAELMETSRLYAHTVAKIEPEWALRAAEHLVKRHYYEPHYDSRSGQVIAYEKVSLYGLVLMERRTVSYSPIDPQNCREIFIRAALVEGRYADHPKRKHLLKGTKVQDFFTHQQALLSELDELEAKARRRDIVVDDQVLFDFYAERIPGHVNNFAGFEAWRKKAEQETPGLLFIDKERLMRHGAGDINQAQFPNELEWKGIVFPVTYHFEPGHEDDGVSIHVPVGLLHQLPEHRLDWVVPGILREKCIHLVKTLPKGVRKHFVPVPDVIDKALVAMAPDDKPLTEVLAHQLKRLTGVEIPTEAWQQDAIDDYYLFNIKVTDDRGKVMASGRNLSALQERFRAQVQQHIQSAATNLERDDIGSWDFAELAPTVQLTRGGLKIRAYPALVDKANRVALQVLDSPLRARELTRRGLARLLSLQVPAKVKYLQKELLKGQELVLSVAGIGSREQVVDDVMMAAWRQLCLDSTDNLPRTGEAFAQCLSEGEQLISKAQALATDLTAGFGLLVEIRKQLKQQKNSLTLTYTIADIQTQLAALYYPGLVYKTPPHWLAQYPRYLRAIQLRLEKALLNPQKDRQLLIEIQSHWQRYADLINEEEFHLEINPPLQEYRWWIEELRVSLFAQTLKTQVPVSSKRLDKQWQEAMAARIRA